MASTTRYVCDGIVLIKRLKKSEFPLVHLPLTLAGSDAAVQRNCAFHHQCQIEGVGETRVLLDIHFCVRAVIGWNAQSFCTVNRSRSMAFRPTSFVQKELFRRTCCDLIRALRWWLYRANVRRMDSELSQCRRLTPLKFQTSLPLSRKQALSCHRETYTKVSSSIRHTVYSNSVCSRRHTAFHFTHIHFTVRQGFR